VLVTAIAPKFQEFFLPHALSQLGLASGRGLSTLALVGHNDIWLMSYVLFWGQLVHHAIVVKHLLNIYHQSRNLGYRPFLDRPKYRIGCILYIQLISIKFRCSSHYICIDLYPYVRYNWDVNGYLFKCFHKLSHRIGIYTSIYMYMYTYTSTCIYIYIYIANGIQAITLLVYPTYQYR
jgi:hypothetical protein